MKIQPERYFGQNLLEIIICLLILSGICFFTIWPMIYEPDPAPAIEPVPTPEPTQNVTVVELTPEPTPTLSKEQIMEMTGGIPMGQWISVSRDNVTGYQDMNLHTRVWGYRIFNSVEWYSVSWGDYFRTGAGDDSKFLFVFVDTFTDEGSARMWGLQPIQYYVNINGKTYERTTELKPEIRIHELDDITVQVGEHRENRTILPYGYIRTYNSERLPVAEEIGFIKSGRSNMWSGYIPFIIPRDAKPEDIQVSLNGHHLMEDHYWQLE